MKPWAFIVGMCCFCAMAAQAQLSVEILLEQQQFLKDEAIPVKVRITNRSGQTVQLGKTNDWLTFAAESRDGYSVSKLREPSIPGAFSLESATVATRRVDLGACFDFDHTGRYSIGATVKIPEWDQEISSRPVTVEVVKGSRVWQQEFGVPAKQGAPEMRKYILQQARFLKDLTLYVRVTDLEENHTFQIYPVGTLVSFSHPEAQVDRESKLHLLFQNGARTFLYSIINPDGSLRVRQVYDYAGGLSVRLKGNEGGEIFVSGGERRMAPEESTILSSTNEVKAAKP